MKRIHLIAASVLLIFAAVMAGCLTTGTAVITVKLSPDADGVPIRVSDALFDTNAEIEVDLNDDATFKDYRDDIRNIDNIGFYLSITNNDPEDVTFQLFIEPDLDANYQSPDGMIDSALTETILTGLHVPANQTVTVNWNQSMEYLNNLDYYKDVLEGGVFSLYAFAFSEDNDIFDVTLDSLVVIVTLTGSK